MLGSSTDLNGKKDQALEGKISGIRLVKFLFGFRSFTISLVEKKISQIEDWMSVSKDQIKQKTGIIGKPSVVFLLG